MALLDAAPRPCRERCFRRRDGPPGVVGGAAHVVPDDLVGIGRIDVGRGFAVDPIAVDVVAMQIVHGC